MYKYRKGVFIVAYTFLKKKPIYLLLHRKLHWRGWEFPKGGLLANENLEHAVVREIKEETGLEARNVVRYCFKGKFIYDKKTQKERKRKGFSYVLFSCYVEKSRVKICKREHDSFKWCFFEEALNLLTWENQKKCLEIVNNYLIKYKKKDYSSSTLGARMNESCKFGFLKSNLAG